MKKALVWGMLVWLVCITAACKSASSPTTPEGSTASTPAAPWLQQLVQQLEEERPANPPARIYRYTFNGEEVYFLTGRCCDIPSKLYSKQGDVLCEPDGGITGRGDGKCPDFFEKRTHELLIWEDKREQ